MKRFYFDVSSGDGNVEEKINSIKIFQDSKLKVNEQVEFILYISNEDYKLLGENFLSYKNFIIKKGFSKLKHKDTIIDSVKKKDSTLYQAIFDISKDKSSEVALLSSAQTGLIYYLSVLIIGTISKDIKPTLVSLYSDISGETKLALDIGSNPDVTPEDLVNFALLGKAYFMSYFEDKKNPKICLLNIGEEKHKGDITRRKAYEIFKKNKKINFKGNIESNIFFSNDKCDVVVVDGFTGNAVLKTVEGLVVLLKKLLKEEINGSISSKMGVLFLSKFFKKLKLLFNEDQKGGSLLLGLNKIVLKTHGDSVNHEDLLGAFKKANLLIESNLIENIKKEF